MSQRPYDYVSKGEQLCEQQKFPAAERAFEQAIRAYEKEKDPGGVAFALGRLGSCYEGSGEKSKAIDVYRRAITLGTDIPAIYHGLIGLLVDRGHWDEAFAAAAKWQKQGQRNLSGPAHQIFTGLGAKLTREKRYEEAIALLSRTVATLPVKDFPNEHWDAVGSLGHAYEKSEAVDKAADIFATAIEGGSNNRQTYTRYLMYLEKTKQYVAALRIIRKGLKVQKDASWEADLLKRQQRIEKKAGKIPKGAPAKIIPAYSIRRGNEAVLLIHQIKFSPQIMHLAVWDKTTFVITGGKNPILSAWNLDEAVKKWQVPLLETPNGILVNEKSIVTYRQSGRVGDGETILYFYDKVGAEINQERLPDAFTEIATSNGFIYAGCRDGKLYAFTDKGKPLWSYQVPGSQDQQLSDYSRPCPYYVRASTSQIVFSSFNDVFALSTAGKLQWHWSVPEKKSSSQSGGFTVTMSFSPALVRGLAMASKEDQVVITADDTVYELIKGELHNQFRRKDKNLGGIAINSTGEVWAFVADNEVQVLHNKKLAGRFPVPVRAQVSLDFEADIIIARSGKEMSIASGNGKIIARFEFVKNISHAFSMGRGKVVVGAGHLVILGTTVAKSSERVAVPIAKTDVSPTKRHSQEHGIPVCWFEGEKLNTGWGKAFYRNRDNKPVTIEQFAIEQYSRYGWAGNWTENEYWWAIMALLFWDVIFARLPGVFSPEFGDFPGPMQDMPQDFFTSEFYSRRKPLIEKRISELTQSRLFGLRKPDIEAELRTAFHQNKGKPCRPIDWNKLSGVEELVVAVRILTSEQLMKIMRRLLENFVENRKGLPDLFLTQGDKPLFVEVKSEKEKIADHQKQWLFFLRDQVGFSVEICRIFSSGNQ